MRHLDDGALRRLYDEPEAVATADRAHAAACRRCQDSYARVVADAQAAASLFTAATTPGARVDPALALRQVRRRVASAPAPRATGARLPRRPLERMTPMYAMSQYNARRVARPAGVFVAAAALVAALALTPAGSLAASLVSIFEPQQFTAVPITSGDLQGLPPLASYGTMTDQQNPTHQQAASASDARRITGLPVRTPAALPLGVPSTVTYNVLSRGVAAFTFDASKARAAAAKSGKALPPMPADLDGATLRLSVGPIVVATYGGNLLGAPTGAGSSARDGVSRAHATGKSAIAQVRKGVNLRGAASQARGNSGEIPSLVIVQAPRPSLTATNGVTVQELENYLAGQPGVSPQLAAEIRGIGDPGTTLPVPIPIDRFNAQHVTLADGTDSLVVGDNTGVGSGAIWQEHGMVYAVGGTLTQDQVVAIANSLR
jgi:hypothetical protein